MLNLGPRRRSRGTAWSLSLRVGERAIWNAFLGIPEVLTRARQSRASGYAPRLGSGATEPITEAYRACRCDGGIVAQIPVGLGAHLGRSSRYRSFPLALRYL